MEILSNGFYYHYKHDPEGEFNNYAYEVLGLARHSEDQTQYVMYRPLYENTYLGSNDCSIRPVDMFMETVNKDGISMLRFTPITDSALLTRLKQIRSQMYDREG